MYHHPLLSEVNKPTHNFVSLFQLILYFTVRPVPEAAVTVVSNPDDGYGGHPKHVE